MLIQWWGNSYIPFLPLQTAQGFLVFIIIIFIISDADLRDVTEYVSMSECR